VLVMLFVMVMVMLFVIMMVIVTKLLCSDG
jgi:hypothetical protein